ncbi:MAG: hypothetical protein IPJ28_13895 [Betaproteobacteria bacterium]|nr:hypothetical protein [Betaproteobacteria bacterium]
MSSALPAAPCGVSGVEIFVIGVPAPVAAMAIPRRSPLTAVPAVRTDTV